MNTNENRPFATLSLTAILLTTALLCATPPALAEAPAKALAKEQPAAASRVPHLDFELDPLAFIAKGFSVHAGIRIRHYLFSPPAVTLGGDQRKKPSNLVVFPTLHLGYRFP